MPSQLSTYQFKQLLIQLSQGKGTITIRALCLLLHTGKATLKDIYTLQGVKQTILSEHLSPLVKQGFLEKTPSGHRNTHFLSVSPVWVSVLSSILSPAMHTNEVLEDVKRYKDEYDLGRLLINETE